MNHLNSKSDIESIPVDYRNESILVVDGDLSILAVTEELLRVLGFGAASASSGVEALRRLQAERYSFLLTDMKMSGMDGFELIKQARQNFSDISIIAMMAHAGEYKYIDIMKAGASDFIKKPIDLQELEAKIIRIIQDRDLRKELSRLSITDPLTSVFNRRHFFLRLKEEMVRANRQKYPLCLILVDLDNFKEFNDTHGHVAGDELLKNVARLITKSIREGVDSVFRYGGDEFAVILIDADVSTAEHIGNRIRQAFREGGKISGSTGCAKYNESMSVNDLVAEADRLLYAAKTSKAKVASAGPLP
jgi:two-component system cell cycle response regulator